VTSPTRDGRIDIRPATREDAGLLLEMIRELAEFERLAHEVVADVTALRSSLFDASPAARAVIAELEGSPAGFALWFYGFSTFAGRRCLHLEDLFVRPAWRGSGVGRALLSWLARVATREDCARMEWAVLDWNERAIDFYRSIGASRLGDWTTCRLSGDALARLAQERERERG
jgi:GNAT superfamily N-acetyltransferase